MSRFRFALQITLLYWGYYYKLFCFLCQRRSIKIGAKFRYWCYCQSSLLIRSLSGCLSYIFSISPFLTENQSCMKCSLWSFQRIEHYYTYPPSLKTMQTNTHVFVNCQRLYWSIYKILCMMLKLPSQLIYKHKPTTIVIIIIPENSIKHPQRPL